MLRRYRRSDFSLRIICLYEKSRGRVFQIAGKKIHFKEMWLNSMRIGKRGKVWRWQTWSSVLFGAFDTGLEEDNNDIFSLSCSFE